MENVNIMIGNVSRVPEFTPEEIWALMYDLQVDERAFALLMNVSPMTVRLWTKNVAQPCSTARRLMQVYRDMPCVIDCLADGEEEEE